MHEVRTRIKSMYDTLPAAQQAVADYVLSHGDEAPFLSVQEIAAAAQVSVASVSRFARSLGFARYRDFKMAIGRGSRSAEEMVFHAIEPEDSDQSVVEKVFLGNIRSLEETLSLLSSVDVSKAAKTVARAERVVFFGIAGSGHLAADAALRFSQLGVHALACNDSYGMLNQALDLGKRDVAVGISHSGRSWMTVHALEQARCRGATTIGISNYMRSPLHGASRIFLCTSFSESRVKVAALSSSVAQMCLLEAVYLLTARHLEHPLDKAEALNKIAEALLRSPTK